MSMSLSTQFWLYPKTQLSEDMDSEYTQILKFSALYAVLVIFAIIAPLWTIQLYKKPTGNSTQVL